MCEYPDIQTTVFHLVMLPFGLFLLLQRVFASWVGYDVYVDDGHGSGGNGRSNRGRWTFADPNFWFGADEQASAGYQVCLAMQIPLGNANYHVYLSSVKHGKYRGLLVKIIRATLPETGLQAVHRAKFRRSADNTWGRLQLCTEGRLTTYEPCPRPFLRRSLRRRRCLPQAQISAFSQSQKQANQPAVVQQSLRVFSRNESRTMQQHRTPLRAPALVQSPSSRAMPLPLPRSPRVLNARRRLRLCLRGSRKLVRRYHRASALRRVHLA